MNDTSNPAGTLLAPLQARWRGLDARERRLVGLGGLVLALGLLWGVAIAPAWRTLRSAPAELEALETQLQQMQRLASEARELRGTAPVPQAGATAALRVATERLGADKARLVLQGDRAVVTLQNVPGEALRGWLAEARSGARARPVEAQLTRGPGGFGGTVTMIVGGGT